ncbi:MAG: aldehyde dehydrogenase [Bacteroidetes bacterium]|nr:MAG: aldehyde dehydrogenase [Bacteroidota bacterium]
MEKLHNYIQGALVPPLNNRYLDVYNPANGAVYLQVPASDEDDLQQAVAAAQAAFPHWSSSSLTARQRTLSKIADLIEHQLERLSQAESRDNGKPLWLARTVDIPRAAANFRFFAHAITQFASEAHEHHGFGAINYTLREPLGVVGCISPWNLPLYLLSWKIAPALAAGNCVIAKPSEVTPLTASLLAEICIEADLPPGVLNIVHGRGEELGAQLVAHPKIRAISFTGSTRVGREIARTAAPMFKKLSLEMGGKNPNLIFADCDYEDMIRTTMRSSFANQGQICLCGSRIYVERRLYDHFKIDFVARTQKLKVGDPAAADTKVGAVVSRAQYDKILSYFKLAQQEGGRILCGGQTVQPAGCENGWFIEPTIIEGLGPQCRTNQEEIFGPVVTLTPFDSEEEVVTLANSTPYGLSATVWTQNLSRAHRLAKQLEAGIVWINSWLLRDLRTPFGGVKQSGVGREGGWEALRFFTEPKNVCIKYE